MVVEDYFTKWTEAIPIPNAETTTVARKFAMGHTHYNILFHWGPWLLVW
jgi:hypothetical protein